MKKTELKQLIRKIIAEVRSASLTEDVKRRFIVKALVGSNQSSYWEQDIVAGSREEALAIANKNQPDNPTIMAKVDEVPLNAPKGAEDNLNKIQSLERDLEKMEKDSARREANFHQDFSKLRARIDHDLKGIKSADAELTPGITENTNLQITMKKSELKQLIRKIITEIEGHNNHPAGYSQAELDNADFSDDVPNWKGGGARKTPSASDGLDLTDTGVELGKPKHDIDESKGLSGFKEVPNAEDNTQMGKDDKSITSTDKPVEKKEGKKLPVKDSTKNTETDHFVGKLDTGTLPTGEKKEKVRPVGATAPTKDGGMKSNGLKETVLGMIREALQQEMAKTPAKLVNGVVTGGIGIKYRKQDPNSPTGWVMTGHPNFPDGTPVEAPKLTGKNYVPKGKAIGGETGEPASLEVSVQTAKGKTEPLEFDFLNNAWPASKKYIESEVMSMLGDAAIDPNVKIGQEVYDAIEAAKAADLDGLLTTANNRIILYYDPSTKQLRAKTK
jgi:hypothetical protein